MNPNTLLTLTTAILIGGNIVRAGSLVEVSANEAADLLRRGRARKPTDAELSAAEDVTTSGTVDASLNPGIPATTTPEDDGSDTDATQSDAPPAPRSRRGRARD